ncbi:hypothetical protein D3C84_823160 [compost metagenome]
MIPAQTVEVQCDERCQPAKPHRAANQDQAIGHDCEQDSIKCQTGACNQWGWTLAQSQKQEHQAKQHRAQPNTGDTQ